jgi:hypothetical protein
MSDKAVVSLSTGLEGRPTLMSLTKGSFRPALIGFAVRIGDEGATTSSC